MKIKKLRSVIIDDSELERNTLVKIIKSHLNLTLVNCFHNALDVKTRGLDESTDLIFLNIDLPFINGFDFLETLQPKSQVVVTSNSSEHALRAFEYNVTDYLLKPIEPYRFNKAIKKALQNSKEQTETVEEDHFFVKSNFRKVRVNYNDIQWVEALGDYVRVVTRKSNLVVLSTMKAFQNRLPANQFLRIHKSYIINLKRIENFNHTMVEVEGKKMPLSRKRKDLFMDAVDGKSQMA